MTVTVSSSRPPLLRVLGELTLSAPSGSRSFVPGQQLQFVLALLTIRANRVVHVEDLVDVLWRDRSPRHPKQRVFNLVHRTRALLAEHGAQGRAELRTVPGGYVMEVGADGVDLLQLRSAVAAARSASTPEQANGAWARALAVAEDRVLGRLVQRGFRAREVEAADREVVDVFSSAAAARFACGDYDEALRLIEQGLRCYPGEPRLLARLARVCNGLGQPEAALEAYARAVRLVRDEAASVPVPVPTAAGSKHRQEDARGLAPW